VENDHAAVFARLFHGPVLEACVVGLILRAHTFHGAVCPIKILKINRKNDIFELISLSAKVIQVS
jgi:hypothetical protein